MIGFKTCRKCKIEKPISEFHPNKECSQGVLGTCRVCNNSRVSKWIDNSRDAYRERTNKRSQEKKREVVNHFGDKCHDCGNTYPQYVYHFHHLDPKEKDVNPSKAILWSPERMWNELKKCIMLCANCHMVRHHG